MASPGREYKARELRAGLFARRRAVSDASAVSRRALVLIRLIEGPRSRMSGVSRIPVVQSRGFQRQSLAHKATRAWTHQSTTWIVVWWAAAIIVFFGGVPARFGLLLLEG